MAAPGRVTLGDRLSEPVDPCAEMRLLGVDIGNCGGAEELAPTSIAVAVAHTHAGTGVDGVFAVTATLPEVVAGDTLVALVLAANINKNDALADLAISDGWSLLAGYPIQVKGPSTNGFQYTDRYLFLWVLTATAVSISQPALNLSWVSEREIGIALTRLRPDGGQGLEVVGKSTVTDETYATGSKTVTVPQPAIQLLETDVILGMSGMLGFENGGTAPAGMTSLGHNPETAAVWNYLAAYEVLASDYPVGGYGDKIFTHNRDTRFGALGTLVALRWDGVDLSGPPSGAYRTLGPAQVGLGDRADEPTATSLKAR